ncbi:MAG: response regulator [Ectobacillus sp.]
MKWSHWSSIFELRVEDDGIGTEELRLGFGLKAMKERLAALQGELALSSFLNKGMIVTCRLPILQETQKKIKIAVIDDDVLVRDTLSAFLSMQEDMEMAGTASDGKGALHLCEVHQPDVVLMDVQMEGMGGLEAAGIIKERCPDIRVIMMTTFDDIDSVMEAIRQGAAAYVLKSIPSQELLAKIRLVNEGETFISSDTAKQLIDQLQQTGQPKEKVNKYGLTERELDVLQCLAERLKYKEIAGRLFLAEGTVRNYTSNIYAKLAVENRAEAAKKALNEGII